MLKPFTRKTYNLNSLGVCLIYVRKAKWHAMNHERAI
jgi:hypothetical protein